MDHTNDDSNAHVSRLAGVISLVLGHFCRTLSLVRDGAVLLFSSAFIFFIVCWDTTSLDVYLQGLEKGNVSILTVPLAEE